MIGGGAEKITVEIGGKIAASLGASLRKAQTQVSSFGRNITRTMNDAATAGKKGFKNIFSNDLWQGAAAGAASVGLALGASVRTAASFEAVLSDIGKTANASQGELKALSGEVLRLSGRNVTNLGPEKLAQGIQDLVAQGLELGDAIASMEALGKVATATNSDLLDVTKTGFQLQNALKIRPTELKATFDALAFAGKQGAFELKDMAQFMPTIAAAAGSLGIQGREGAVSLAAMMQMVRKDAPDAGQAATRLTDAMLKMTAPDAVKRFAKFGVNIEQVLKDAKAKGINPMEAALTELQRVTGGDIFKLSQIFGDKEAKLALMSLMKYRKEYEKLKADAGGQAAAGTVERDFQRSLATFQGTLASFQNASQRLGIVLGNALLPPLTRLAEVILPVAEAFANFATQNPAITGAIVGITAGLSGLVLLMPFVASTISVITTLGASITAAGGAGVVLGGVFAALTGPVGIAVAAIAGIGFVLFKLYQDVGWFRAGVNAAWGAIAGVFQASATLIGGVWQGLTTYLGGAWKVFTGILNGDLGQIQVGFGQAFNGIRQVASAWLGWFSSMLPAGVRGVFSRVVAIIQETPRRVANVGSKVIEAIINGLKSKVGELFGWIRGTWDQVTTFFGGADPGEPQPPARPAAAPMTGTYRGGQRSASPPGRAMGGRVRAGTPYIVGERRRELFVPGMDGAIIPRIAQPITAGAIAAMLSAQPVIAAPAAPSISIAQAPAAPSITMPAAPRVELPDLRPPLPPQPQTVAPVTIHAPVTINAGPGTDAMEIRRQVELAFMDIQREIESSHRVLLND
jgi:TP901 family phage tail tape measure protein